MAEEAKESPRLVIILGSELGRMIQLTGATQIGRSHENEVSVQDEYMSRVHCVVEPVDGKWIVRDLDSMSGIEVDDVRLRRAELVDGSKIKAGRTIFKFLHRTSAPERQLVQGSTVDPLTGLANRLGAMRAARASLDEPGDTGLLLADIVRFSWVNDVHGTRVGDQLLRAVGFLMKEAVGQAGLVSRWSGQCFGIHVHAEDAERELEEVEHLVADAVEGEPVVIRSGGRSEGFDVQLTMARVVAADGESVEDLVRSATESLRRAKAERGVYMHPPVPEA